MYLDNKAILITGGTGSLGQTLVKRILSGDLGVPSKVIVFSRDEAKQHDMRVAYQNKTVTTDEVIYNNFRNILQFRIGDIRDFSDVCSVVKNVDIIVNAAALKQVPTCEYFPMQAVMTNVIGASNIVRAIEEHGYPVETVIGISTDKACKPVNVMGMTKSLQERIFSSANVQLQGTRFVCIRYGNVLASRGSVIPLFRHQIMQGGPLTITVPEMTRFLLSLNQAVDTVFEALQYGRRGEIFVPNAPAATILHIAKALIGDRQVEIQITGIRPGEKLHEIMVSEEEALSTFKRGDYWVIQSVLPELVHPGEAHTTLQGEFSSSHHVLDLAGTTALLKAHNLLLEDNAVSRNEEILR